jgi:hypothetical protein
MKALLGLLFAINSLWDFIYRLAIVAGIIILIVVFISSCANNMGLNEHSSCQQFQQADSSTQDNVVQAMEQAHGDTTPPGIVIGSIDLYCDVYGSNAPIDGIYGNGGGDVKPQQRRNVSLIIALPLQHYPA